MCSGIKQEINNMLHDMRNLPDSDSLSISLVRETLESLLAGGGEEQNEMV